MITAIKFLWIHNTDEDVEILLTKNNDVLKKGYININYGGFDSYDNAENQAQNPYEADITLSLDDFNQEVESIIQEIIESLECKIYKVKKIESLL